MCLSNERSKATLAAFKVPDGCTTVQHAIEKQLAANAQALGSEREKIISALAANGRYVQKLAGQRILLTVILSYVTGLLTILIFDELLSFLGPMLH